MTLNELAVLWYQVECVEVYGYWNLSNSSSDHVKYETYK